MPENASEDIVDEEDNVPLTWRIKKLIAPPAVALEKD